MEKFPIDRAESEESTNRRNKKNAFDGMSPEEKERIIKDLNLNEGQVKAAELEITELADYENSQKDMEAAIDKISDSDIDEARRMIEDKDELTEAEEIVLKAIGKLSFLKKAVDKYGALRDIASSRVDLSKFVPDDWVNASNELFTNKSIVDFMFSFQKTIVKMASHYNDGLLQEVEKDLSKTGRFGMTPEELDTAKKHIDSLNIR